MLKHKPRLIAFLIVLCISFSGNQFTASAQDAITDFDGNQGICPGGWHIPDDEEWTLLLNEMEGLFSSADD